MNELDQIVLRVDIPQAGLKAGDIGTIVLVHKNAKGFEVEFTTLDGDTVSVQSLAAEQVRTFQPSEIPHARPMQ